jgi:hypothetical protein
MNDKIGRNTMTLAAGDVVTLFRPRGLRFASCRGVLWLTIDGERDDVILQPGESMVARGNAAIVVSALHDEAVLRIRKAPSRRHAAWSPTAALRTQLQRLVAGGRQALAGMQS